MRYKHFIQRSVFLKHCFFIQVPKTNCTHPHKHEITKAEQNQRSTTANIILIKQTYPNSIEQKTYSLETIIKKGHSLLSYI